MSVTVFPVTDQTATVSLFSALKSAVDRGSTDPLSSIDGGLSDTERLQYDATTSGTKSDGTYTTLLSCQIDEGQAFLFEAFVLINDATTSSPGDELSYRISVDSGIAARGMYFPKVGGLTAGAAAHIPINTTTSQVVFGRDAASPSQNIPAQFRFVAVGDTGGGEVKIEWAKTTTAFGNTFGVIRCYMIGKRIFG